MSSLKSNYLFNLLNTISGLLFPIVTFPYVARILMADGIGQVNFYTSIISYISTFTSLGIPIYAIRAIAQSKNDIEERNKTALELLILHSILTIAGYIAVFILAETVTKIQANIPLFLILSTNLIFTTIGCEWFYQGIEDFKYITIRGLIIKILSVILLFILVKDKSDLLYYGVYSVIGIVGGNIFNFFRLRKYLYPLAFQIRTLRPFRHFKACAKILMINLISSIFLQLDTVMLGFLKDNAAVGFYSAALKITKMLMGITTSLSVVILPRFSTLISHNKKEDIRLLLTKAFNYIILLSAPLSVGLLVIAPTLVYLFCGENYTPSISTMRITAPIILFISVSYLLCQFLFSLKKEHLSIYTALVSALTNLILNFIFIPILAQDGAAIGTFFAELGGMITYIVLCKRYIRIRFFNRDIMQLLTASLIMGITISLIYLLNLPHIYNLLLISTSGITIYLGILYWLRNPQIIETLTLLTSRIKK